MSAGPHAYDVDTAVEAVADRPGETGRFAAVITDRGNGLRGRPNGGYVLGVTLRALARVMPEPDPLAVSAFFLRPTLPGPAEVATEMARAGRRTVTLVEKPALPPPEDCIGLLPRGAIPGLTITERVEYRVAAMPGWAVGRPEGRASMEFWMR